LAPQRFARISGNPIFRSKPTSDEGANRAIHLVRLERDTERSTLAEQDDCLSLQWAVS
jgi:hypothetical protein